MLTDSEPELVLSSAKIVQAASEQWNQTPGWEFFSLSFLMWVWRLLQLMDNPWRCINQT